MKPTEFKRLDGFPKEFVGCTVYAFNGVEGAVTFQLWVASHDELSARVFGMACENVTHYSHIVGAVTSHENVDLWVLP